METSLPNDHYKFWYSQTYILFEIVKQLQGREVAFLDAQKKRTWRCIKAHSFDFLNKNFEAFSFFNRRFKIYNSLAYLVNMPMFSFDGIERKKEQGEFNKNFERYFAGYDLGLDIDGEKGKPVTKRSQAYKDAVKLKQELDNFSVPYSLKFSGTKGFHFRVHHSYLLNSYHMDDQVEFCKNMAENLKEVLNLKCLDDSIYDARRIFKVAYSLDAGAGKTFDYVVLPLTDEQFENFDMEICKASNVLNDLHIKNRGLLEHKGTNENMKKFIDEWVLK